MGCYVNPTDRPKEQWLRDFGTKTEPMGIRAPKWDDVPEGSLPVCLVGNPDFTAAGVCFNERELNDFNDPMDQRGKMWFTVPIADLEKVSDIRKYLTIARQQSSGDGW